MHSARFTQAALFRTLFVYLISLFFCLCSTSASQRFGDITIGVESTPAGSSTFGYAEYRIIITNDSLKNSHQVTVFAPQHSYHYSYGDHIYRIKRSVIAGPSSTTRVSILQPPLTMDGRELGVIIDDEPRVSTIHLDTSKHCARHYYGHYGSSAVGSYSILLSRSVDFDDFRNGYENAFPGKASSTPFYSGYSEESFFSTSELPVSAWSDNWLGYSCYNGVVVSASDMEVMPASVKSALLKYVQCGGSLTVLGSWHKSGDWETQQVSMGQLRVGYIHFGLIINYEQNDITGWDQETWKSLVYDLWKMNPVTTNRNMSISEANLFFPVIESLGVPVKGLFIVVLIYGIIIGPVNIFVLSRRKKQLLLLWTTPAIAVVATLAVFAYAFFAEGWRGRVRTEAITILDEPSHTATTVGVTAYYCPVTPRRGLHFDYETEVTPLGTTGTTTGRARTIDLTRDQHFNSGWIVARVPAHFILRKNRTRRERLQFSENESKQLMVLNGLGADISTLWYADTDGRIYYAENIPAGTKSAIEKSPGRSLSGTFNGGVWREIMNTSWGQARNRVIAEPERYLRPDSYIAVMDDVVFVEESDMNLKEKTYFSIVFGMTGFNKDEG